MNSGTDGSVRPPYRGVADWLDRTSPERVAATRREVDLFYRRHGITFGAYGATDGQETTIPFDIIPRVIAWDEWEYLHKGLSQRVRTLNAFLADAYGQREICRAGIIPEEQILMNAEFVAMAQGLALPCMPISPASTSCASARRISTFSRTMCARRRACRTYWRTAK